jgi:diadenosine tetraphosphatase ApaH/serine/threonine PP2A family protein phosphatase
MMNELYGFRRECERRLSCATYLRFAASFNELPIAAILHRNFCVHGGISPKFTSADSVRLIEKSAEDFGDDLVSDLVWSDPRSEAGDYKSSPRGCGYLFGEEAVISLSETTGNIVSRVVRAHETCPNGYDWPLDDRLVLTVFSSCDYCDLMNDAAIAVVSDEREPQCKKLAPLSRREKRMRRVAMPDWAFEHCWPIAPIVTDSGWAMDIVA